MLPKSRRLTTEDFKSIHRTSTVNAPHFSLRFLQTPAGKEKYAVIVSASAYKKAVDRNLLRRRIYHLILKHPFPPQQTLTVTLKKGALGLTFKKLEQEFLEATTQAARRL